MSYSNSNYLLLGLLIEKVTGLSYPAAVHRDLLPGLGERIAVQDAEAPVGPVAAPSLAGTTTVPDGRFLPNRAVASMTGAPGGLAADAATVARWGYRLYGGQILDPRPRWTWPPMSLPVTAGHRDPGAAVGLQWRGDRPPRNLPGYATVLMVNPERQLAIVVLVPGEPGPTINLLAGHLLTVMRG